MKTVNRILKIGQIRLDGDTQPRTAIDEDLVDEYADAYKSKVEIPRVVVFHDGANYWLVDGFHRRWAAVKVGLKSLPCVVHEGTLQDARWYSYAANQTHGLRRTNADKEKAVKAALQHPKGAELSDVQIAEHVGVSHSTVAKYRCELESTCQVGKLAARTGKDGKKRKLPKKKPATKPAPEPAPDPEPEEQEGENGIATSNADKPDPEQQQQVADNEAFVVIEATIRYQFSGRLAVASARLEALAEKLRSEL